MHFNSFEEHLAYLQYKQSGKEAREPKEVVKEEPKKRRKKKDESIQAD